MLIDLTSVANNEEKIIQTEVTFEPDTFVSVLGSFPITNKSQVSLLITNKGDREVQIVGKMSLKIAIPCSRCLEDVETKLRLNFEKVVDLKLSKTEQIEVLNEQNYIDGYNLNVDKLVYGEILVNWPMKVLCQEDCKGLCSTCGTNLNLRTCDCDITDLDPRMAKIRDIFSKFKEV